MYNRLKRLCGRCGEAGGHKFDKVPMGVCTIECEIADLRDEIAKITGDTLADKNHKAALNALLVKKLRQLEALRPR